MHRRFLGNATELPYNNGNRTADSYISEANFDSNMVIILAALLCALISALGLNSIVRCALRCSHRFALETPEQAAARLAAKGLKKSHLRQLPVAVYGEGTDIRATECPICLGEFEDGEKVRVLPKCNHGFHVRCIDTWLVSHSSCPNCRHSLLEHQQPSKKTRTTSRSIIGTNSEATENSLPPTSESDQDGSVVLVIDEAR
ncbi:RING-H2 finger protein ATL74-like [Argentina anserina]|uniref:RING-H2 finger protein ATL74-like n=1 Tax=Argentina anserina TaxID=57926 RepID=UPI0021764768|nr:RING-H2 finger protein ATL74-like [Potentilla anserina]